MGSGAAPDIESVLSDRIVRLEKRVGQIMEHLGIEEIVPERPTDAQLWGGMAINPKYLEMLNKGD